MLARPSDQVDPFLGKGELCLVSSALGLMGVTGYSQYCPTKFAVRGLAEALRQELAPKGIAVSLYLPSNVQTPGYQQEMLTKPAEARRVDETAQTITADAAARICVEWIGGGAFVFTTE